MMKHEKIGMLETSEDGQTFTVKVTVDSDLFTYKTREEAADMLERLITEAIIKSMPLNNVKCRFYKWHGQCAIQKNCPQCVYYGDARKCKILSGNVKLKGV